ncbi:MAG: Gfo/Idh/MocA family oxidoreductase [Chitinophagaceae bacterium]|nr:MAG: Gfo/Idh/MocA family oxidoreductase [Chitinophagaceae bacterium]
MKGFAITGACGFVAPRHLRAIRDTGNELLAAYDRSDSAGILDQYFPAAAFTTNEARFGQMLGRLRADGRLRYLSVCTPNHVHEAQVAFGLQTGLDVICEKPLVTDPNRAEALLKIEAASGQQVYNILQLRLHPRIRALKEAMAARPAGSKAEVDLTYVTPRGRWYHESWKGKEELSGGIATNIGIHFFDMLIWIFGAVQHQQVHLHTPEQAAGYLELEGARVRWFLSIRAEDLPAPARDTGQYRYRGIVVDGNPIEFTSGFENLHTQSYEAILGGDGFGLLEAYPSLVLARQIRTSAPARPTSDYHPYITTLQ